MTVLGYAVIEQKFLYFFKKTEIRRFSLNEDCLNLNHENNAKKHVIIKKVKIKSIEREEGKIFLRAKGRDVMLVMADDWFAEAVDLLEAKTKGRRSSLTSI